MATFEETVQKLNQTTEKLDKAIDKMNAPDPLDKEDAAGAELRREENAERKKGNEYLRIIAESVTGGVGEGKGKKGGGGGVLAGLAAGVGGVGLTALAAGTTALAAGLALFANPITIAGGFAMTAFLTGLAGVVWISGKAGSAMGQGIKDIAGGLGKLDKVGSTLDVKNFVKAGDGFKQFLENLGDVTSKGVVGTIITFFTTGLPKVADGIRILNGLKVDKKRLEDAGLGLNIFLTSIGQGSFFEKMMGLITTKLVPDFTNLSNGIQKLSDVSKTVEKHKLIEMGEGLSALHEPLYEISKSGFAANFVGENALIEVARGISALNTTKVDRLGEVSAGMGALDAKMFEVVKTGFVANFVGENALKEIGEGVTHLNRAEVNNLAAVSTGLALIVPPLKSITGIGLLANFVGKGAITDIADGAEKLAQKLGTKKVLDQTILAARNLGIMKGALSTFTTGSIWNSLKGVGVTLFNFFAGKDSPIEKIAEVTRNSTGLKEGADAIYKIGTGLEKLSKLNFDGRKFKMTEFAADLVKSIPDIEAAINGGEIGGTLGFAKTKIKGLSSITLDLDTALGNITKLKEIMSSMAEPVKVTPPPTGAGNNLWQSKLLKTLDELSEKMGGGNNTVNQLNNSGGNSSVTNNTILPKMQPNNPTGVAPIR